LTEGTALLAAATATDRRRIRHIQPRHHAVARITHGPRVQRLAKPEHHEPEDKGHHTHQPAAEEAAGADVIHHRHHVVVKVHGAVDQPLREGPRTVELGAYWDLLTRLTPAFNLSFFRFSFLVDVVARLSDPTIVSGGFATCSMARRLTASKSTTAIVRGIGSVA
jgi:hypothetical protein